MDNEKLNGQEPLTEENSGWLEDLLTTPETGDEISADENAVSAHGMGSLSDMELEKIMQEAMSDDWNLEAILAEEGIAEPFDDQPSKETPAEESESDAAYSDDGEEPEEEEEEDEEEEAPEETGGVPRKVRPKRKKGYGLFGIPHLAATAIWIIIAIMIGISLGRLIWVCAADILAFGREDRDVTITISETDTLDSITTKLYNAGLIKYQGLFKLYADLAKVEEKGKISVGTFELNTLYDYHALVSGMSATSSYRKTTEVTIPEGYTCAQIFKLLEESGVCTVEALEAYAMESTFSGYWFLEDVPKGTKNCLEGFLFPNTYEFYLDSSAKQVFIKLLSGFESQFDEDLQAQLVTLNEMLAEKLANRGFSESYIEEHKFTVKEVMIVASILEKESAFTGESQNIASVIYNRLTNPGNYPLLNMDSTTLYSKTIDPSLADLYDTYICHGLPYGAISNPGIYSIRAALNPADTKYYFFALNTDGSHKFFKTYEEHLKFLESLN